MIFSIAGVGLFAGVRLHQTYLSRTRQAIASELLLISDILRDDIAAGRIAAVQEQIDTIGQQIGARITVIAEDGVVLADNWAVPGRMENHAGRPEIVGAARSGEGFAERASETVEERMFYYARLIQLPDGRTAFLRLAVRLSELSQALSTLYAAIAAFAALAMVLAGMVAYHYARRQARPIVELTQLAQEIARGNLSRRTISSGKGETAVLGQALNAMAGSIQELIMQTQKDKAELLTILAAMNEGIIATDAEQNIVVVNSAAANLLGFDQALAKGVPLWQVVRMERLIRAASDCLETGQMSTFEAGLVNGRYLEISIRPFPADAAPEGLVVVAHDMTQSVRYQELRKEFVANVSHELRTPLTVIKGFIETLKDGAIRDPQRSAQYLDIIERHAEQLSNLVNDLLELSRLESQPDLPRRISVDLAALARKAADMLAPAAQRKKQNLVTDIQRVPLIVGNPDYLERAISNLVDNAIKYTPEGGRIHLATRQHDGHAIVEVSDNGLGIPAEDLPRIFERFYRVDRSRSRDMGGTGLGLSIVKHIAQSHGGSVEVESTPGQGSSFRLILPLIRGADRNGDAASEPTRAARTM